MEYHMRKKNFAYVKVLSSIICKLIDIGNTSFNDVFVIDDSVKTKRGKG